MTDAPAPDPRLVAHLADFIAQERALLVITRHGLELEAFPESLEPERQRLVLRIPTLPPHALSGPEKIRLAFALGGHRWEGDSRSQLRLDRLRVAVELPTGVARVNRRYAERVVPEPESLRATLKVAREGPVLTGPLVDLSVGGFCLQIERVFNLATQQRLDPARLGLKPDQGLDSVEITGLGADPLEASGVVREFEQKPDSTWRLRVQFRALLRADRAFLADWAAARTTATPEELPEPE